jgi:hypothetical protein
MLPLMLDPRFKILQLISSFISHDQRVAIVGQDDTMSLYPMYRTVCIERLYNTYV